MSAQTPSTVPEVKRYKARYAPTMARTLDKNVSLAGGEEIIYSGMVREHKNWLMGQPRLFAVTPLRLILVEHNLFSADWIVEIPRSAITQVVMHESVLAPGVNVDYSNGGQVRVLRLQALRKSQNRDLFDVLQAFHLGQLNLLPQKDGIVG